MCMAVILWWDDLSLDCFSGVTAGARNLYRNKNISLKILLPYIDNSFPFTFNCNFQIQRTVIPLPLCKHLYVFHLCIIISCRFHDPWFGKYFDGDPSTGQMQDYSPLPVLHIHLMRLWTAWLDNFPEDFVNNPVIAVRMWYVPASGFDNYHEDFIGNPVIAVVAVDVW